MLKSASGTAIIFLLFGSGCNRMPRPEPSAVSATTTPASAPVTPSVAPPAQVAGAVTQPSFSVPGIDSPWRVSTYPGQETVISTISRTGGLTLFVRKAEGKVECILGSGDVMDSFDPSTTRRAAIRYRFDDGETVSENWMLSEHSTSLRFMGNTSQFVEKIRRARQLEVKFAKTGDNSASETFSLSLFPEAVLTAAAKTQ